MQPIFLLAIILLTVLIISRPLSFAESVTDPPLKQVKRGVLVFDVKCADDLVLILKASNGFPACIRQSEFLPLIERGWGILISTEKYPNINPSQLNMSSIHFSALPSNYHLAYLISSASKQYDDNLRIFAKYLKVGDYLIVGGYENSTPEINNKIQKIKSIVTPGVNVISIRIYNKIDTLTEKVPDLPRGFDYIGYDYEKGSSFSPEFTTNETRSISYFDQARAAVEQYNLRTGSNAKLIVMPPYGQLMNSNWDWGLAARHMDVIDMQFQTFMKDKIFHNYVSSTVVQIKNEAPDTKIFIQLSLVPKKGTALDNLNAIRTLGDLPIDAFLIFYEPSQTLELEGFHALITAK